MDFPIVKKLPSPVPRLPAAWEWFIDEWLPSSVKSEYSPRESWKDKPFSKEDARFFSKAIVALSDLFTQDRSERVPTYFQQPKFRSAYLLYFLPLQMAKFMALFQLHPQAFEAALAHGRKNGKLRVLDLGAGPGTASIGLLLSLLARPEPAPPIQDIEFVWYDPSRAILEDGKKLALAVADQFPKLRGKVSIRFEVAPWWLSQKEDAPFSLIVFGHVMNEARELPQKIKQHEDELWDSLLEKSEGGGILFVEPAARGPSQYLSRLRDRLAVKTGIWGPCLHSGACPLREGRDWCHFSVPMRLSGKWFTGFSKVLGSERQWLKFSYLWLSSKEHPAPRATANERRVISDALSRTGEVLICEPEKARKARGSSELYRGDLVSIKGR